MSPPKTYQQPCDEFHRLDKQVAESMVIQAGHGARIGLIEKAQDAQEIRMNRIELNAAKRTAIYSAIGASIPVIIGIIGLLMNGGF